MVIIAFPKGTPESTKHAFGEMIREITKDMTPEQFREFERGWNAAELANPLFLNRKPYDAISSGGKKRTTTGSKKRNAAHRAKTARRAKRTSRNSREYGYLDLSKKQVPRRPRTPVVRVLPDGRVRPVEKYALRITPGEIPIRMSPQEFRDVLFGEYVRVLTTKLGTGYFVGGDPEYNEIPDIATRMFYSFDNGIRKGTRNDYLNNNPALRTACHVFGITTSPQFREAWMNGVIVK
jgi:hypothetical protein